jgi:hypothetical protein
VEVIDVNTSDSVGSDITDSSGNYSIEVVTGIYDVEVAPPSGSGFGPAIALGQEINSDKSLNFILLSVSSVLLSGYIYDSEGNPVPDIDVSLLSQSPPSLVTETTDSSGHYSLTVLPGTYDLIIKGNNLPLDGSVSVPKEFNIRVDGYELDQTTILDLTLPTKKVDIHTQDSSNTSVGGVNIEVSLPPGVQIQNIPLGNGLIASGTNAYSGTSVTTNSSGDATLWLFANDVNNSYAIVATPPSGSIYVPFVLDNLVVTGYQTEIISLQFIHEPPVTTADLATDNGDGTYSDPTTVTLSATAASGFTIANTYYTVDGGAQQTYTDPFTVSGGGEHTITFWSIDNAGVPEAPKTKPFTIHVNEAPVVDELSDTTLDEGDTYSANGSFTDPDSTSWTATVDYGDGTVEPLTLSGTNFTLSHIYEDNGIYTVQVLVTDDEGDIGDTTAAITVNNVAPSVSPITVSNSLVQVGTQITATATFTDPGVLDTHTASWNWGDNNSSNGNVNETNGTGSVSNSHTYTQAGVYEISLTVTDNDGSSDSSVFQYLVVYDPTAGFLTGAGRFASPDPAGNVIFGVSAKYTGTGTPTGEAKINFQAGDITLDSTSYQWLVVTGAKATLKGNATVNGSAGYTFIISGIDGSQTSGDNLIRVKITDSANNVIYDTQPGDPDTADPITPLSNGTIKVH